MSPITARAGLASALLLAAACAGEHPFPTAPDAGLAVVEAADPASAARARAEALARQLARALADPDTRAGLHRALAASRVREGKLHFQRQLRLPGSALLAGLARAGGRTEAAVREAAEAAIPLELYLPVEAHRARWRGGEDFLVATALADDDPPVAFDRLGRRSVLSPDHPPETPVLALVPVETDFDRARAEAATCLDCGGGDGGTALPSLADQHLVLTWAWFRDDFEGWLKGSPEYELHVLAPNGKDTTAYRSLQCVGEHAPTGYYWNQNSSSWSGQALVFTGTQMDSFGVQWPGQAWMIMALEDDDASCEIRMDKDLVGDVLEQLDDAYKHYKGLKDRKLATPDGAKRLVEAGKTAANLVAALGSLIKTNDDLIGMAIRDSVAVLSHPTGNHAVLRDGRVNGWLRLGVTY